ncbi:MAG TPA: NF038122 family metalloprotease [Pyrinomonadaceae bacterium]|nr:NF038122 family metalloprotease [Pyrinomonadaceae bacterium]
MLRLLFSRHCASRITAFALLAGLCWTIFLPHSSHAKFQTRYTPQNWTLSPEDDDTLVIYQNERGETTCRRATKAERDRINSRQKGGSTRLIYAGAPRKGDQTNEQMAVESPTGVNLLPSAGLRIVLHGTTQLEQNQTAKNAFIVAANRWEAIVATPITIVIDVDFGTTFFGQAYSSPNILGQTTVSSLAGPFSDLRQRLINHASSNAETELYSALPASELPTEVNDVASSVASARATAPNARALGIIPDITNPDSRLLGQGDASIGFNSAHSFDFNPDDGIDSGLTDFDAVAVHEIGHALGFTSNAGGNTSLVSIWDIFRFKPARATLATFGTTPRILSIGGDQVFFGNQVTTYATLELGLSTGGPNPGPGDGDGRQSSHWRDDSLTSTRQYIGIMDPTLSRGLRRTMSENDVLALDLFGYAIGGPAPVRPPNDNFANAFALPTASASTSGSTSGTNVNATREAGEPFHATLLGDKSVWYTWVSQTSGQVTFDTVGSNFDTTLSVYTGSELNQLFIVQSNDDILSGSNKQSQVLFNVTSGQTYRIAVDGWNSEFGNVTLNWTFTAAPPTPTPTPTPSPTPTPTPTADLAINSFSASPDPVPIGESVDFVVVGQNLGPSIFNNTQLSIVLPSGVSFVSCDPACTPPAGADGGTATAMFQNIFGGLFANFRVTAKVNAANGTALTATANISSSVEDPNPANNGANTILHVNEITPFTEAKKIAFAIGGNHVLALRRGTVWAWGFNVVGQLGDGTFEQRNVPVQVEDLLSVVDIAAGQNFSLALKSDGTVWTWGDNSWGRLGTGSMASGPANRPVQTILSSVTAIAANGTHAMALKSDGTVWVWGANTQGDLGLGVADFGDHPTPVPVPGLSGIVSIFLRGGVSYAMKGDGTVFGWGTSFSGQLGDGSSGALSVMSPLELPALKGMLSASPGSSATIVLNPNGSILSFGNNSKGQLGRGLPDDGPYPVPTQIPGLTAKHVSAGSEFAIVTEPSGTLKVFGRNDSGQLGLGSQDFLSHPTPVSVPGISNVFATVAGGASGFALIGDPATGGMIRAWGVNPFGILGIGTTLSSLNPALVRENLTVARPIFSIAEGTIVASQVQIVCGTPGSVIHYTTNGTDPTENDPVIASGGFVMVDHSLTLKARAFRSGFIASAVKSAIYTVGTPVSVELLLDQLGPAADQAAALEVLTLFRDPFSVLDGNNLLNSSTDHNTRVLVFVRNLQLGPGEQASAVVVNLVGSNSQNYDVPAEDVRAVTGADFVQVSFRLPDSLAPGTCTIRIKAHAQISNAGTIRIKP